MENQTWVPHKEIHSSQVLNNFTKSSRDINVENICMKCWISFMVA